jgi:putative ABC transport system permease protein
MAWHHRILNILRSNRISSDIDREVEFHIAEKVDALVAGGMSEEDARLAARRQFGNPTSRREETRAMDIAEWVQSVAGDIRYAVRSLLNAPVFAVVTIASLGLGIGANTTIFSLLDAVVLRPLAVENPSELAYVGLTDSTRISNGPAPSAYFTNPLWEQVRDRQDVFSSVAAFGETDFNLADGGEAHRVSGSYVSGDFFNTFRVSPAAGRLFTKSEDVRGCAGSVVLSHRFWEREYGSAPGAVGKVIRLDGHPFEISGIAESSFRGPDVGREPDLYVPICAQMIVRGAGHSLDRRSAWWMRVIGRLAPGVDVTQANARIATIARASYEETIPEDWDVAGKREYATRSFVVVPAEHGFSEIRSRYRKPLFALMAGVALILLIACANVANLLLSRAEARHRELAVRLAIGADRRRLLRQLITESMVMATAGAVVGVVVASFGTRTLVSLITTPGAGGVVSLDLSLNLRLLAFTTLAATVTVILCGLAPAWRATRVSAQSAMKAQSRGVVEGHTRFRLGKSLVVAQVALSLVLLVSAGFLVGTLRNLSTMDPGFDAEGVLLATVDVRQAGIPLSNRGALRDQLLERTRSLPGVVSASSSGLTPIGSSSWNDVIVIDGFTPRNFEESLAWFNEVSDGYFTTLGTRLLAGRDFNAGDVPNAAGRVAVVNEAWTRRFIGGGSPVGRQFRLKVRDGVSTPYTIVGLVENSKYQSLREGAEPIVYVAATQEEGWSQRIYQFRVQGDPLSIVPAVRNVLREVNPAITVDFSSLSSQVGASLQREKVLAILSALFGSVALVLAVLGLYGVMSYTVARRRGELGVRIALGAERSSVVRLVLNEVGLVVAIGLVIGAVGARYATTQVTPFLYGTESADSLIYVGAAVLLAGVAMIAGLIPAMRAARVDPIEALREQ